jgi:dynein heavy chain, axonemal
MFLKIKEQIKKMGCKNSFNIFLKHELNQMQKLLNIVRTSLSNLKLAIEGVVSLNEVHKLLNEETKLIIVF